MASMLASDPERSRFRIAKASLISSTRPALTSVPAPFAMTRRFGASLSQLPCGGRGRAAVAPLLKLIRDPKRLRDKRMGGDARCSRRHSPRNSKIVE
jgi:hypothetical protein